MLVYQDDISSLEEKEGFIGKYFELKYNGMIFIFFVRENDIGDSFVFVGTKGISFIFEDTINVDFVVNIIKETELAVKVYGEEIKVFYKEYIDYIVNMFFTALARTYAVEELLGLKNEVWVEDGIGCIDSVSFAKNITLEKVKFLDNGNIELWCDDGDMFFGHTVFIEVDSDLHLVRTDIAG